MGEAEAKSALLAIYDRAMPQVYGYLYDRCRDVPTAEDLTAETFVAAVGAVGRSEEVSVPWLIGVARHKLVDHWRRRGRDERLVARISDQPVGRDDPWDVQLDAMRVTDVLARLGAHHRVALTLRYVDGLPVPEVADLLGRTIHATEALLVRARSAFRKLYESGDGDA